MHGPPDTTAGPAGLRIRVLGQVTATDRGAVLDLGGLRQRAVLSLLVVARGGTVAGDRLIDSLWAAAPPPGAVGTLQVYVSRLRRLLEPGRTARSRGGPIASEGSGYALRISDDAVDAWQFERLLQHADTFSAPEDAAKTLTGALALWRGPAFTEYAAEPWARSESERLTELREVARERLLAARLDCGADAALVPELEALVAEDPLRERRWHLLALALYRTHRRADALGALGHARQILAEELGVDPGPALRSLEEGILTRSPALDAPQLTRLPRATLLETSDVLSPMPGDLVDRNSEVAELRACLFEAVEGHGTPVFIEGPAGIGKSRLLAELRQLTAREEVLTLTARGSRREKDYGFGVVRQLLDKLVAERGSELLAGPAAPAASVFDPMTAPGRQPDGFAIQHSLYWLIVRLTVERPLVLAVDDLHWSDSGSLHFLAYLARRLDGLPVLIAATVRTGEPHDEEGLLTELASDPATVHIRPAPLTADGGAALVRAGLGDTTDDAFATACHRATAGNPLLLRQLIRALKDDAVEPTADQVGKVGDIGSRAVSRTVLTRLARMPDAATAVARAIAVLGDGAALPAIAALAGLSEDDAAAALAPLIRAEVVRDHYPLSFAHPLLGEAVYRDLAPAERRLRHEQAARVLHATGATPEQVAAHLLPAPQRGDPWVVSVLQAAAREAAHRGAADAATTCLARALREPPAPDDRPRVLLELGRCESLRDGPAAVRHLREAYRSLPDPADRAPAALLLAGTLFFAGTQGEPTAFARQARTELPAGMTDERQALLALERVTGYMHGLDPRLYRHGPRPAVVGDGPGARMLAAALAWETTTDGADRAEAVALARFALADNVLLRTGSLWALAATVLHHADEPISGFWHEALDHAHRNGSFYAAHRAHVWKGYALWGRGDLPGAHNSLATANSQLDEWGTVPDALYACYAFTTGILVDLGDVTGARAYLDRVDEQPVNAHGARLMAEAQAGLLIEEGRHREALAALDGVRHLPAVAGASWWPGRSLRAQALAGLGRRAEATTLTEAELVAARTWGAPSTISRALRIHGELRGADGVAELREAIALCDPATSSALAPAGLEHARALHALAAHEPPRSAVRILRRAHAVAQRSGAASLLRSITSDLEDLEDLKDLDGPVTA
ncbi:BTAD domain-containing putative transcriptional regulator [Streptomyces graminilatus]|uniref:BTAD domain-containing putative transcriptional regulator n=1 Tax=Streptomyces graminilatus TaxID=1464070 RepID=UPI0006E418CE|nr:BTAD domain-containing putative transcriptional regulator [Streptomyces graminilatus]